LPRLPGLPRPRSAPFRRLSAAAMRRLSRISLQGAASDALVAGRSPHSSRGSNTASYSAGSGLRFHNPTFSASTASLAAMPIEAQEGPGENPMYGAYVSMSLAQQKATDYTAGGPAKPPRLGESEGAVVVDIALNENEEVQAENAEEDTAPHPGTDEEVNQEEVLQEQLPETHADAGLLLPGIVETDEEAPWEVGPEEGTTADTKAASQHGATVEDLGVLSAPEPSGAELLDLTGFDAEC